MVALSSGNELVGSPVSGVAGPPHSSKLAAPSVSTEPAPPPSVIDGLVLAEPPMLDPVWRQHEIDNNLPTPPLRQGSVIERQPLFAVECRELTARLTAPGTRDHQLSQGIATRWFTTPSSLDGHGIPVFELRDETDSHTDTTDTNQPAVVVYIHGGGLHVGEADSEDLPLRRIIKETKLPSGLRTSTTSTTASRRTPIVYSVGYRLMPQHPASTCVADCLDAVRSLRATHPTARFFLFGSSSGGELATLVAQEGQVSGLRLDGVVLRCPVTSDVFKGKDPYVPADLRPYHTSASNVAFQSSLLGFMQRAVPRDGLPRMPLEAPRSVLQHQPKHWIQVCTNDTLYSDGLCYAKALEMAGVPVRLDVVRGWPHTFWNQVPWMERALEADRATLAGLVWVAGG